MIRPTAALYWLPLALTECARAPASAGGCFRFVFAKRAPVGAVALGAAACVDRLFYGAWTFVPWNFVRFNLLEGGSAAYGAHPWHWYVTQGAPVVATVFLPLAVVGCVREGVREPAVVGVWTVLGHSLVAHKEFRFLMPALPSALTAAGAGLARSRSRRRRAAEETRENGLRADGRRPSRSRSRRKRRRRRICPRGIRAARSPSCQRLCARWIAGRYTPGASYSPRRAIRRRSIRTCTDPASDWIF